MPMRNPGRYVVEAVESILSQSDISLELLIVDDGSTDGSRQHVDGLQDVRLRIVDGPRSGISACMNRALDLARGKYVMRCDSDDIYPVGRIASQVEFLRARPHFVGVCGPFSMIAPDGRHISSPSIRPTTDGEDVASDIVEHRLSTHLCAFAFRRNVLPHIGGFRPFFETAEDIDFQLRLATAGPIGFVARNAYDYRLHDASITHTQASQMRQFFEDTAYAMSHERWATGSDALMRGEQPVLPNLDAAGERAGRASAQMSRLLVGEAWTQLEAGDRTGARRAAGRAILADPRHWDAWRSLLLVSVKRLK
jgi:glycosyltransferase involved in cell wall biosynthesis